MTESAVRKRLARQGYSLRKDRVREYNADHFGGYMIVNERNVIEAGEKYNLDLDDVIAFANEK